MAASFKLEVVETKRDKWTKYVWMLYVLWLLMALYVCYTNGFKKSWSQVLFPTVLSIIYILNYFFSDIYKKSFLVIDDTIVSWKFKQMPSIIKISWADIEWVKFEKDGISIYQKSSFNTFLNTDAFTQEQKEKLTTIITEIASEKNIKLVS